MLQKKFCGKNLSPLIDLHDCDKCGAKCCTEFTLQFDRKLDAITLSEVERYRLMESNGKIWVEDTDKYFIVHFDFPCSQLSIDGRCRIYDDNEQRPMLCRIYPEKEDIECHYKKTKRKTKQLISSEELSWNNPSKLKVQRRFEEIQKIHTKKQENVK